MPIKQCSKDRFKTVKKPSPLPSTCFVTSQEQKLSAFTWMLCFPHSQSELEQMNSPGSPCVSPASCLHYFLTRLHLSLSQIVSSLPYYLVASLSFTSLHLHTFTSNYNFSITSITCHLSAASQLFTLRDQSTWTVCLRSGTPSHSSHQGRGIELVRAPSSGEYLSGGGKQKTHTEKEKKVRKMHFGFERN